MNWERIFQIACSLKPLYDAQESAFEAVLVSQGGPEGIEVLMAQWVESIEAYNAAVWSYLPEIAKITNNSLNNMQMLFSARDMYHTRKDPEYLRQVANYGSFNDRLWSRNSGLWRSPERDFQFPVAQNVDK